MNVQDILIQRLSNQHLAGNGFNTPREVIEHLGAMQSQEFLSARWGIGMRGQGLFAPDIEDAYDKGEIIRTHIMRPTWHFILPEDLLWMQELTSQRVRQLMSHYNKKLELTPEVFKKTNSLLINLLKGHNFLTRQEIKKELEKIGIQTDVQRLAHIMMWPELDGIVCSGPLRGGQLTYALVEERIKKSITLNRENALRELAIKYFQSHGPASIKDFSWWSGLSMEDSQNAVGLLGKEFDEFELEGRKYFYPRNVSIVKNSIPYAHLLSIFDEYTIAYKDRSALGGFKYIEELMSMGNALTSIVILNGQIAGTWKRVLKKNVVNVDCNLLKRLNTNEKQAVNETAQNYANFLGLKLHINISQWVSFNSLTNVL